MLADVAPLVEVTEIAEGGLIGLSGLVAGTDARLLTVDDLSPFPDEGCARRPVGRRSAAPAATNDIRVGHRNIGRPATGR